MEHQLDKKVEMLILFNTKEEDFLLLLMTR